MDDIFSAQEIWKLGVLGILGVAAFIQTLRSAQFPMVFIGAMLFISTLGLTEDASRGVEYRTWLYVFQVNRQLAYMLCAAMVMLGVAIHASRINTRTVPGLGIGMMLLGVYMGLITIFHVGASAGLLAVALSVFSVGTMLIFLASQMRSWGEIVTVLRVFVMVGCLWTLACTIQFLIDQTMLTTGFSSRRFVGLTGNPQHAAGFAAVMATVGFWVYLNDTSKRWRFFAVLCAASHIVFVLWTASRTGLAMSVMGFAGVLYSRLGRAVFLAPVAVGVGYGLLTLAQAMGVRFGFERLVSTDDTRSHKWMTLIENGFANPIIGVGLEEAGGSENGFLYGFAAFGIGVPIILAILMLATLGLCLRLVKTRFDTPNPIGKRLIDLTLAFFAMYWAGNMFEGFGVARISPQLCFFVIFACMASSMFAIVQDEAAMALEEPSETPEDDYPAPIRA